jgi:hypothetical protein
MAAINTSDGLRFPPVISDEIAAEIEAIAWSRTDLLGDIPDSDPDPMFLASMYADAAAEIWVSENDCPPGYLPHRIIDAARKALVARIAEEIERRDDLVRTEYDRRARAGRIDINGVGDVPTYYEREDIEPPSPKHGRDSDAPGCLRSEVFIMSVARKSNVASLFHFKCPDCGFTDAELGPAQIYQDHCEICMQEGRSVRLKCWPVEEDTGVICTVVAASWNALPRRQRLHQSR